jgi:hypothetical protein
MNERPSFPGLPEPEPVPVEDWQEVPPLAPGFITVQGTYANAQGQRFRLTAAARERDADALERYRAAIRVWLWAGPPESADLPPGEYAEPDQARPELSGLICDGLEAGDRPVLGLDLCQLEPHEEDSSGFAIFGVIDPPIEAGARHCFKGPERVIAIGANVTLGGLTVAPHSVGIPPRRDRHANNHCWVRGDPGGGSYTLNAAWQRVPC